MLIRINKNIEIAIYSWLLIALVYSMLLLSYITSTLSILLFLTWILFSKKNFALSSTKTRLMILFVSLYVIYILGLTYTNDVISSLSTFEAKSAILFFPLIFGTTTILDRSLLEKITTHFLIAVIISCIAGLINGTYNYFQAGSLELLTGKGILFFSDFRPFLLGLFYLTAIIIAFEKIKSWAGRLKYFFYVYVFLLSIAIFLLSIRMLIAFWFFILIYYIMKSSKSIQRKILFAAIPLLIIIISAFTIPSVKNQWNEFFDRTSKSNIVLDQDSSLGRDWGGKALRFAIWKCSADILLAHWLIGVGTGDVQDSLQQAYENRKFYFASRYNRYNAHNQYIQIGLATGLPGLLIFLSCILYPLWHYKRKFTSNIYLLFLLFFSFICFSESVLEANKGVIWYSFFNSIFAFGYLKSDKL
jgi:O-antigen ligase